MKEERQFCDRCKKEILISYDINDKWKEKKLNLCSSCHSEFERFIKTKDTRRFEMERKYYRWREASCVLGGFLLMFATLMVVLVANGICR